MKYSEGYYEHINKIKEYEAKLKDLDDDYATLQASKGKLAKSSVLLGDISVQCADIDKAFDRGTIEGKYDACQIVFDTKETVFEYLENIGKSTGNFKTSCSAIKNELDLYGITLDECCKTIADQAIEVEKTLSNLKSQTWKFIEAPEAPIPPEVTANGGRP